MKKILLTTTAMGGLMLGGQALANADSVQVSEGQTLSEIASTYNTDVDTLASLNHLSDPNVLSINQTIELPGNKTDNNQNNGYTTYTVKSGDTLASIGNQFNVSADSIMSLNGLTSTMIYPGQTLKVNGAQTTNVPVASNSVAQTTQASQTGSQATQSTSVAEDTNKTQAVQTQQNDATKASNESNNVQTNQAETQSAQTDTSVQSVTTNNNADTNESYTSNVSGSEAAAKAWIKNKESGGNYNATNGRLA